jgi:hypothetical protein
MAIMTAIAAAAASATLRNRQSRKTERDRTQLNLLCDAGVMRARDQWNRSQDYQGETWIDTPSSIGQDHWKVTITLKSITANNVQVIIQARIEERVHIPRELQETRTLLLPVEPKS